jgi:hypothetical protein
MKMYIGAKVYLLAIVTSVLNGDKWLALSPGNSPLYSLDKRVGRCWNNKNSSIVT